MYKAIPIRIRERRAVERVPADMGAVAAVEVISGKGTADMCQMHADLVGAPRFEMQLSQGICTVVQDAVMRDCGLAVR